MDYIQVSAKTVEDAVLEAAMKLATTREHLEYEVISKGSAGFLGFGAKDAVIKARALTDEEIEQFYEVQAELAEQLHEQLARDAAIAGVASQQKPVHSIIDKSKEFLDSIKGVQNIHIYGFSFSEIDIPYLEAIINVVGVEKTLWEISDFEGKGRTKIEKFISNYKINDFKIIELSDLLLVKQLYLEL